MTFDTTNSVMLQQIPNEATKLNIIVQGPSPCAPDKTLWNPIVYRFINYVVNQLSFKFTF